MKLSIIFKWAGPAAIAYGMFLVVSDMSGMPMPLLDPNKVVPMGSSLMGSGLILWALVMLLVGMMGLYAQLTKGEAARKTTEHEARHQEWELDEEELLVEEFEDGKPEGHEAEVLLVSQGFGH